MCFESSATTSSSRPENSGCCFGFRQARLIFSQRFLSQSVIECIAVHKYKPFLHLQDSAAYSPSPRPQQHLRVIIIYTGYGSTSTQSTAVTQPYCPGEKSVARHFTKEQASVAIMHRPDKGQQPPLGLLWYFHYWREEAAVRQHSLHRPH